MGLGSIIAGSIAGAVSAAANAVKNNSSKGSSSGGKGSGSSNSGGSAAGSSMSGGSTGYIPQGVYNDADLKTADPAAYEQIQQLKNQYEEASQLGDKGGMQNAHDAAEAIRKGYGYSGGEDGSQKLDFSNAGNYAQVISGVMQAADEREEEARRQEELINQQYEAALGQTIADLKAQKGQVGKLTEKNNAAAEKAYMQTIKPNGSLAESLAANGLLSTGATESSQIAAGNSYQNALNSNATTEAEAIAEIERMISQARYENDLQRLQALQQLLQNISEMGYENAMDIAGLRQWGIESSQNQQYNAAQLEMQRQQLEMQKQELEAQRRLGVLTEEQYRLQNQQLQQEIQYNEWQLRQAGMA